MNKSPDDDNLTVEEIIQLELCGVEAVIEAADDCPSLFLEARNRLRFLLDQLCRGEIEPEHAEVKLEEIQAMLGQWLRDNPIPPA